MTMKPKQLTNGKTITAGGFAALFSLITYFEGYSVRVYADVVGIPTVCHGHTGADLRMGEVWTDERCKEMTYKEIRHYVNVVDKYLTRPIPHDTFVALVSLAYNIGEQAFRFSTAIARINKGDIAGGCEALKWFNKAKGRVIQGLVNRRAAEYAICMKGI